MKPPPANSLVNRVIAMTLTLLVLSGTLGLGAVWMRQSISSTANRSRAYEGRITDVERRLDEINAQVATALNPDALLRQNQFMNLTLATPREVQVVRVPESAELRLATKRNREVFNLSNASTEGAPNRSTAFRVVTAALH
jgi:predicted GIY-YIG superfamily endonuclease